MKCLTMVQNTIARGWQPECPDRERGDIVKPGKGISAVAGESKAYKKLYSLDNIIPFIPILNLYVYWTLSKKYLSIDSALSLFVSGKLAYFIFVKEIKQ